MATQTNGHRAVVIQAAEEDCKFPFSYADCQVCDWHGEGHSGPDAEDEASNDAEGHETDMSFERPQMGGEPPVLTEDVLLVFIYLLLRDQVQPGDVEQMVLNLEENPTLPHALSNGFLAGYAENIAGRLRNLDAPIHLGPTV